jgi:pilus assembly protein Flp/PilA
MVRDRQGGLVGSFIGIEERAGRMLSRFTQTVVSFLKDENGPTAVEYAVMLALIIVVCIVAITALGTNANNTFSYVANKIGGTGS